MWGNPKMFNGEHSTGEATPVQGRDHAGLKSLVHHS